MRAAAGRRIDGMDAARGTAMLFVCLSHFGLEYFRAMGDIPERVFAYTVGRVASPTFMLISGITVALLYERRRSDFARLRLTLVDRGIFMLTLGHVLIMLSTIPRQGSLSSSARLGFITDAIGVAILVGPTLVQRIGPAGRALLAAALYVIGVTLTLGWAPDTSSLRVVRYLLVGAFPEAEPFNFPLLPWVAVYLVGTAVGQVAARAERRAAGGAERTLAWGGVICLSVVIAAKFVAWYLLPSGMGTMTIAGATYDFFSPWQKLPAAPAYLASFGGCGLFLIAAVLWIARRGYAPWFIQASASLGRASLFAFILQFYVYYVGFHLLELPYTRVWPMYFVVSVVVIWVAARWWDSRGYQRYMTVGLRASWAFARASVADGRRALRRWTRRVASNLALD
jgi:uncharacterized membrane protein